MIYKTKEINTNTNRFIDIVNKYTDIKELTPKLLRNFVDKVYVSNKQVIDGKKTQKIKIVWNCIDEFNTPN